MSQERRKQSPAKAPAGDPVRGLPSTRTIRPRPKLLIVTSLLFALWIAFLLVMYFWPRS